MKRVAPLILGLAVLGATGGASSPISLDALSSSASWSAGSNQAGALFGWSVSTAGDVNGDGFSDVVVGAPNFNNGAGLEGKVFFYFGTASGLQAGPGWSVTGQQAGAQLGYAAATAGDVNGDGYDDVIFTSLNYTDDQVHEGRAWLYLGSPTGPGSTPAWTADGNQADCRFGQAVATAGDVNGDGYDDVIVGASQYDDGDIDEGRALLYLGSATGLSATPAWTYEVNQSDARLGESVAGAGDVNGDGYDDIVVGAYQYTADQFQEGRASLFLGSASGPHTSPDWTSDGNQNVAWYAVRVATAGDVNGDGYADVLVGTWNSRAYVYLGSGTGVASTPVWVGEGNESDAHYGTWVSTAGDVNGDGYSDIIIGAYLAGLSDEGKASVYEGSAAGPSLTPVWSAVGQPGSQFGLLVGSAGDVNGDGYGDVIVGAPTHDDPEVNEGGAFVYLGCAALLAPTAVWTDDGNQADLGYGQFGGTAGDVNGDGYADLITGDLYYQNAFANAGRADVFMGGASGLAASPAWTIEGGGASAELGADVAGIGDVNGDGYGDVAVGSIGYSDGEATEGEVRVYHGSPAGLAPTPAWRIEGNLAGMALGARVARAGDVNCDGYADLLVGTEYYSNGQTREGFASLYLGSPAGLSPTPAWSVEGNLPIARLGASLSGAGDVNGDGCSDVIVGAPGLARAWVYLGSSSGLFTTPAWTTATIQNNSFFGQSVSAAGDVNGDGYSDVVVGAQGLTNGESFEGAAYVYLGSSTGLASTPAWATEGDQAGARYGYSVAGAGDVNGDGYSDVVVGAPFFIDDLGNSGRLFLFLGAASGLSSLPGWTADGSQSFGLLGTLVAPAGDVNGDGYADLLAGDAGYTDGQFEEGQMLLYPGNGAYGLSRNPRQARFSGAPMALYGGSDRSDSARLRLLGRTPAGRGQVKLEWDMALLGTPLDDVIRQRQGSWTMTGAPGASGSTADFNVLQTGLYPSLPHHWRARLVTRSPFFPRSPWFTPVLNGPNETDFRTAVPCYDFDNDGYGVFASQACTFPFADCDGASPLTHPGAAEICDGADNDCNAVVDDVPPPAPIGTLTLTQPSEFGVQFFWGPGAGAEVYDIVRGDLGRLSSTHGDYAQATEGCLTDNLPWGGAIIWNSGPPPVGSGQWFLIRAACGGIAGTYDSQSPAQFAPRDAGIAASGLACP